ncbi:MAG: class I adenylate-forming enzyme family protein [Acidimicrobiales bacterium]
MANRLVVLEATGPAFVDGLRRAWDDRDAVLPLDPRLPAPARDAVLAAARVDEPVEPGDAIVVASSGTTGVPKAVVLTHEAVTASALATSHALGVDPTSDRWLACLPLAHVGGLSVVTRALLTGTPLTVHAGFEVPAVEQAAAEGCTLTSLVPTALGRIDPSIFRAILVGGQAPPLDRPGHVIATYGMTETGSGVFYDGVPLDGVEVRIEPDGEIHLRAPMLLRTYRDGTDPKLPDGFFPTGDVGEVRDGQLHVHGRRGDLIITGGENVWPTAVERALVTQPDVAEVAVVGRPDAEWGQRVVAIVVPTDVGAPPTLETLREWAKRTLPAYAAPTRVEITSTLPRTASGKVRRDLLSGG